MAGSFLLIAILGVAFTLVSGQTACLGTSSTTTYVANPTSCSAWIACQSGKIINQGTCASGYLFDTTTSACAPASGVTCQDTAVENICQGQTDGSYIANPLNCNGYFYCDDNIGSPGLCNSDYTYNASLTACVYSPNYTCPPSSGTTTKGANLTCADVPSGTFLPNSASCSAYFVCVNGSPVAGSCNTTIPLYFNSVTGACDYPSNVDCTISSDSSGTTTLSTPYNYTAICGSTNSSAKFASDPANCTGYFYCSETTDDSPSNGFCPNGLYFDQSTQECSTPADVTCVIEPCVGQPVGYFAGDSDSCEGFYYCSASGPVQGNCTTGYYFDVTAQNCNSPNVVQCTVSTTTTTKKPT